MFHEVHEAEVLAAVESNPGVLFYADDTLRNNKERPISHDRFPPPNGGGLVREIHGNGTPAISGKSRLVKYYSIWPDSTLRGVIFWRLRDETELKTSNQNMEKNKFTCGMLLFVFFPMFPMSKNLQTCFFPHGYLSILLDYRGKVGVVNRTLQCVL